MNTRGTVLAFLVVLSVITYLDRVCIAVAGVRIQDELGITPEGWGWVLGVFFLSYGLFEIPTGAWGDRYGQRRVITRIVLWWSAFTCLTGAVSRWDPGWNLPGTGNSLGGSLLVLVLVRFLFGAGEAGAYPNMAGALSRWFHSTERARAQGAVWGASRLGGAIAPLVVVPLMVAFGWRVPFFVFGAVGIVWAVVWFAWYRDPPHAGASAHAAVPWGQLFRHPRLWLIMAMGWCYGWGASFYLGWLHTYLVKGRGLTESEMGPYAALPFILGAVGNLTGGFLSDRLTRSHGPAVGRRLFGGASLALSATCILIAALTTDMMTAVIALAMGYGVMDCMLPASWANCMDVGGRFAGAVSGAMNTAVQAGAFIATVLFGVLVERFDSYNAPLFPIAATMLVAAVLFTLIDPTKPLVPADEPAAEEPAACA